MSKLFEIDYPKSWTPIITAIKYVKYQLETETELRDVSAYFLKADWSDRFHVIIEDKENDTPDYYCLSEKQIRDKFGDLEFLSNL
jgi:hypothetical protein